MFNLTGKVAAVTGGGSGIGRAISAVFGRQGAHVFVLGSPMLTNGWPNPTDTFRDDLEAALTLVEDHYVSAGNAWPLATADGSMAVHYEHDVLITEDGHRVLTEGLDEVEDLITR